MATTLSNSGVVFPDSTTQITALRKDSANTFTALQTFSANISTDGITEKTSGAGTSISVINGSSSSSGTLTLRSTSSVTKATAGILMIDGITSTSTTTGTLKVTGGVGISENLNVGGTLRVTGGTTLSVALTVPSGGTGFASASTNGIIYGNSSSALQVTAASIPGSNATISYGILTTNVNNVPVWTDVIDGGTY